MPFSGRPVPQHERNCTGELSRAWGPIVSILIRYGYILNSKRIYPAQDRILPRAGKAGKVRRRTRTYKGSEMTREQNTNKPGQDESYNHSRCCLSHTSHSRKPFGLREFRSRSPVDSIHIDRLHPLPGDRDGDHAQDAIMTSPYSFEIPDQSTCSF